MTGLTESVRKVFSFLAGGRQAEKFADRDPRESYAHPTVVLAWDSRGRGDLRAFIQTGEKVHVDEYRGFHEEISYALETGGFYHKFQVEKGVATYRTEGVYVMNYKTGALREYNKEELIQAIQQRVKLWAQQNRFNFDDCISEEEVRQEEELLLGMS